MRADRDTSMTIEHVKVTGIIHKDGLWWFMPRFLQIHGVLWMTTKNSKDATIVGVGQLRTRLATLIW